MGERKVVAISSTARDLPEHRKEVMDACLQQDMFPKMMEHLPASPMDAISASHALIYEADIYLGVFAYRYGYVPPDQDISITEMEYNWAVERDIPRLIFLMDEDHSVSVRDIERGDAAVKLEGFKKRVSSAEVVNFFKSPEDLRAYAVNSLSKFSSQDEAAIAYNVGVVEMISPTTSPIAAIMGRLEPYPGFPYFSHESDHPTQWPPRVHSDRDAFSNSISERLSGPAATELARWRQKSPLSIQVPGKSDDDLELNYAALRSLLAEQDGDFDVVEVNVGEHCADALRILEEQRRELEQSMPNRLLILQLKNKTSVDVVDMTVEIQVAGTVYDVTVNAEGEKEQSARWKPGRFTIDLPLIRPNYTADLRVWYYTLPLEGRVFPGPMDLKWAQTEGIVIENLAASSASIVREEDLLKNLIAYHRYPVDPVRGSPTFQQLSEVFEDEEPSTAELHSELVRHAADRPLRIDVNRPSEPGPYAMLAAVKIIEFYDNKVSAFEAQADVAGAFQNFAEALGDTFFEYRTPVHADYSPFQGNYTLEGQLLAIVRNEEIVDIENCPGVREISAVGSIEVAFIPWDKAQYEVVLHFFSDPMDTRGDSKRLLTKQLPLSDIFDLQSDQSGQPNAMTTGFADLLRYARRCLVQTYGQPFTLDDQTGATAPFYLVVRSECVSENFYLPRKWMTIATDEDQLQTPAEDIFHKLSRLYDYGDQSRELTPKEFGAIFDPSV